MHDLAALYIKQHGRTALRRLSPGQLCSLKFVVARVTCRDAGNGIGVFLDNVAWAMILNRTMIATPDDAGDCNNSVQTRGWMMRAAEMESILEAAGCPLVNHALTNYERTNLVVDRSQTAWPVRCCEDFERNIVSLNVISLHVIPAVAQTKYAFGVFNPIFGDTLFSCSTIQRFMTMSGLNESIVQKGGKEAAAHSRDRGMVMYGHLAIMTVKFSDVVKKKTKNILSTVYGVSPQVFENNPAEDGDELYEFADYSLQWPDGVVVIGYHGRHQNATMDETRERKIDAEAFHCLIRDGLAAHRNTAGQSCTLLLASDRGHTLVTGGEVATAHGCHYYYVHRNVNLTGNIEQGPWTVSYFPMADLYLTSHSQYFMGMVASTFSNLIANILAARREIDAQLKNQKLTPIITPTGDADIVFGMDQRKITCESFRLDHIDHQDVGHCKRNPYTFIKGEGCESVF